MKKCGFTLAEVLITLGIIGVIAALTAPSLVKNSGQAKIGPALAKFVNTFETGCDEMMTEEGISRLSEIGGLNAILEKLTKYIIMSPNSDTYYTFRGAKNSESSYRLTSSYILKDGSCLVGTDSQFLSSPFEVAYSADGPYKGNIAILFYDINGPKGKNIAGRETFLFILDDSGLLVPYGSNAHKHLYEKDGKKTFKYTCRFDYDPKEFSHLVPYAVLDGDYTYGFACTGVIADNNWKANY